jgi:hypothetical protein
MDELFLSALSELAAPQPQPARSRAPVPGRGTRSSVGPHEQRCSDVST